jgi:hypothetical protein
MNRPLSFLAAAATPSIVRGLEDLVYVARKVLDDNILYRLITETEGRSLTDSAKAGFLRSIRADKDPRSDV